MSFSIDDGMIHFSEFNNEFNEPVENWIECVNKDIHTIDLSKAGAMIGSQVST